ncbi:MAG: tetratricopeptide (TPR) repeat protein [Verrucomicrobiales bacterium]|jgi:tetratricopeptide (TPR) repeat protein
MSKKKRKKTPLTQSGDREASAESKCHSAPIESAQFQKIPTRPPRTAAKTWVFRLLAILGVPLLLFGGIESILRIAGTGYDPAFLVTDELEPAKLRDNYQFGWRFFPRALSRTSQPIRITEKKPGDVVRILVVGGSAAMGDPEPAYGVSRVLQVLLETRFPEQKFEVINAAVTAINSHIVLPIVRDCARLDPDAVIVYMGNNEVHGPFGSGTVFGEQAPPLRSIRAGLALKKTKTGQMLDGLGSREGVPESWGGLQMFLKQQVPWNDPKLKRVYSNFEANLSDIVDAATSSGAKVLVSSVAVNLKDSAPFISLPIETTAEWKRLVEEASNAENTNGLEQAIDCIDLALALTPEHAELHYRRAHCLLKAGNTGDARTAFARARDRDALRFRADTKLNAIIRNVAEVSEAELIDAEKHFADASPDGIPGENLLWEHVHFNFEGSYLLACLFADRIVDTLTLPSSSNRWPDMETAMNELGLTLLHRKNVVEKMQQRTAKAPFSGQFGHLNRQQGLKQLAKSLEQEMFQFPLAKAMSNFQRILAEHPDDWILHQEFATLLIAGGDVDGATAQRREVNRILPHYASGFYELGTLLNHTERWEDARPVLRKAITLRPDFAIAINSLGISLSRTGAMDEACSQFARAIELVPDYSEAYMNWGFVLNRQAKEKEAIDKLTKATENAPDSPVPHMHLGGIYVKQEQYSKAVHHYEEVARLSPQDAVAHLDLGMLYLKVNNLTGSIAELERSFELNPHETTRQHLEKVRKLAAARKK